ncbi:MAG: hypothetical protein ABF649_19195 [Bacillus sp. (in: firmicutes)]
MKKIAAAAIILLLLVAGCQDANKNELDTSKLKKVEMKDVTDKQKENMPITYEAASVKEGMEALPFEMKLPEELSFDATFQPPIIEDLNHDGKVLMATFRALPKKQDDTNILIVKADYPVTKSKEPNFEEIKLNNGVNGKYYNNNLVFQLKDVSYTIIYINKSVPTEEHKKEIINIANQMVEK